MSLGNLASLNGFVPFPGTNAWNTDISSVPLDPNSATIMNGISGIGLHPDFSSVAGGNYGIPYVVVDSSTQPVVPLTINAYASESDVAYAPFPSTAPIEGYPAACADNGDQHVVVLDRNTCFLYETWNTTYCNGKFSADSETIWDLNNYNQRPFGWTSADAAGLSVFSGLIRYDEVAAGVINHAIRFTLNNTKSDSNGGYFVAPATHAAGNSSGTNNIIGMRLRLRASFDISGYSATNQVILTAMKKYGIILADNGSNMYIQGTPDARWNDSDLANLHNVTSSDFDVVQMAPAFPGYDANTAPTGAAPTITSFTASATSVSSGTPVTLTWSTTNDSYDFIDKLGGVRGPNVIVAPTATTTYTLNATNAYGRATKSVTITVTSGGGTSGGGAVTLTSVSIAAPASMQVGSTQQLTATCNYSDGSTADCTATSTWSSATPAAATITSAGMVTAVAAGSSVASANRSGVIGTATITVTAASGGGGGGANVSISLPQRPLGGWSIIPGGVRHINATITGGTTNKVNWSISATTGGATATLSAGSNAFPWVDITIGSNAGNCTVVTGSGAYTVSSTATVTLQAQSAENTSKAATLVFPVCANTTDVQVVPFYRVAYANQPVSIQSWVVGNSNQNVTWAITNQPSGGNGALADGANRDTVFSASVAGRYTITATSVADGTKTQFATVYVTGNAMPYTQTPNSTEPVDCTVDPNESGSVLEVGPSRAYTSINAALTSLWNANNGDWHGRTVRVHNDDTTGSNPTTYHEYIQLAGSGTQTQPFRIVGCPDTSGNLPIMDGSNSTGASWISTGYAAGYGVLNIVQPSSPWSYYHTGPGAPAYQLVEGLHIRNGNAAAGNYNNPGGGTSSWGSGPACVNNRVGSDNAFVGLEIEKCSDGFFSDFNSGNGWGGFNGRSLYEGNYVHGNGEPNDGSVHQWYVQGWLQLVQFNITKGMTADAQGSNYKDRGISIVRYNYFGDGTNSPGRTIDAVANQDSPDYLSTDLYSGGSGSTYLGAGGDYANGDTMGVNLISAWYEQYHNYFIYGNVMQNSQADWIMHYSDDNGMSSSRPGTAYFYNNTVNLSGGSYGIFDNDDNSGTSQGPFYEYPWMSAFNSIFWQPGGLGCWNRVNTSYIAFGTNLVSTGNFAGTTTPIANGLDCTHDSTAEWSSLTSQLPEFTGVTPLDSHMSGINSTNFKSTSTQPFNSTTYAPVGPQNGSALTGATATMPVRFKFIGTGYYTGRTTPINSSNGGTIGAVD